MKLIEAEIILDVFKGLYPRSYATRTWAATWVAAMKDSTHDEATRALNEWADGNASVEPTPMQIRSLVVSNRQKDKAKLRLAPAPVQKEREKQFDAICAAIGLEGFVELALLPAIETRNGEASIDLLRANNFRMEVLEKVVGGLVWTEEERAASRERLESKACEESTTLINGLVMSIRGRQ